MFSTRRDVTFNFADPANSIYTESYCGMAFGYYSQCILSGKRGAAALQSLDFRGDTRRNAPRGKAGAAAAKRVAKIITAATTCTTTKLRNRAS